MLYDSTYGRVEPSGEKSKVEELKPWELWVQSPSRSHVWPLSREEELAKNELKKKEGKLRIPPSSSGASAASKKGMK